MSSSSKPSSLSYSKVVASKPKEKKITVQKEEQSQTATPKKFAPFSKKKKNKNTTTNSTTINSTTTNSTTNVSSNDKKKASSSKPKSLCSHSNRGESRGRGRGRTHRETIFTERGKGRGIGRGLRGGSKNDDDNGGGHRMQSGHINTNMMFIKKIYDSKQKNVYTNSSCIIDTGSTTTTLFSDFFCLNDSQTILRPYATIQQQVPKSNKYIQLDVYKLNCGKKWPWPEKRIFEYDDDLWICVHIHNKRYYKQITNGVIIPQHVGGVIGTNYLCMVKCLVNTKTKNVVFLKRSHTLDPFREMAKMLTTVVNITTKCDERKIIKLWTTRDLLFSPKENKSLGSILSLGENPIGPQLILQTNCGYKLILDTGNIGQISVCEAVFIDNREDNKYMGLSYSSTPHTFSSLSSPIISPPQSKVLYTNGGGNHNNYQQGEEKKNYNYFQSSSSSQQSLFTRLIEKREEEEKISGNDDVSVSSKYVPPSKKKQTSPTNPSEPSRSLFDGINEEEKQRHIYPSIKFGNTYKSDYVCKKKHSIDFVASNSASISMNNNDQENSSSSSTTKHPNKKKVFPSFTLLTENKPCHEQLKKQFIYETDEIDNKFVSINNESYNGITNIEFLCDSFEVLFIDFAYGKIYAIPTKKQ